MDYEKILADILEQESTGTFWANKAVAEPDIYRLEKQSQRWYYSLKPVTFYESITTWLKKVMPIPYHLENWFKQNDIGYLDEKLHYSSNYGTFAHIMMALLLRNGSIDLKGMDTAVDVYWAINEMEEATFLDELATREQWIERIKNDLLCIVAFIQERNFEAIAIEWIGSYDGSEKVPFSWAGQVDLVGELDWNGGRKTAIIDLKTGSLYNEQVYQLMGNKYQWSQHNSDIPVHLLMNLQPGKFSNKSKYKLKNRKVTDKEISDFQSYAQIASRNVNTNPRPITDVDKVLSRDSDLSSFSMSAEEYVEQKHFGKNENRNEEKKLSTYLI